MEHQRHNPDDREPHIPEEEQLWPGEIDLTGAVEQDDALRDVIGDAITEAEASPGEVPKWGARTLARALANRRDDPHSGALHHFAITGRANKDAIAQELVEIYEHTDDEEIKDWVDRLGTYIVSLPDSGETAGSPQAEQGIREHGDAFRAFLSLPDTESRQGNLLASFQDFYVGAYESMNALFEAMTDIVTCKAEVDTVAERWGFDGLFIIDQERLAAIAHAIWDIVKVGDKLYVFSK